MTSPWASDNHFAVRALFNLHLPFVLWCPTVAAVGELTPRGGQRRR
jgi:hypothetical protein